MSVNGNAQLRYYSSDPPGYFDYCPGSQVTVYVQYYNGSSWVNITSAVVNASTGTYNISFTPVTSANHRIYQIVTNDGTCSCSPTYTSGSTYINKYVPVTAGWKINTSNASMTTPYQGYGYNCPDQSLIWNNTSAGSQTYGFQWKLYYQECNSTGGGLIGSPYGQTTWSSSAIANSYDLKTFGSYMGTAAAVGKYFLITLEIKNSCSGTASVKQGIVYINSAPSNPTGVLKFSGGYWYQHEQDVSHNIASPVTGGCYSLGIELQSTTGNVLYYRATIDQVNCSTGAFIQNVVNPGAYTTLANNLMNVGIGINSLPEYAPIAYLGNNSCSASLNNCYKLTVNYGNICDDATEWTYFKIDATAHKTDETLTGINDMQTAETGNTFIQLAPNPANNFIGLKIDADNGGTSSIRIYDVTGRELMLVARDFPLVRGENTFNIDITELSSGTYIMQILSADGYRSSLKFIKNN